MTISTYMYIQHIIMGFILALGCLLIFIHTPQKFKGSRLHHSTLVMGIAIIIIPTISFIYSISGLREASGVYDIAVNISAYSLATTFVTLSYYILLGQVIDRLIMKIHLAIGAHPFLLWFGLCFGSEAIIKHVLIAAYTLFCVLGIIDISTTLFFYKQRLKSCNTEEQSCMQNIELTLLRKTIYPSMILIALSILLPSFITYPIWAKVVFLLLFIGGFANVFISYYRGVLHNECLPEALDQILPEVEIFEDITNNAVELNRDTMQKIESHIKHWIKRKEFLLPNITMSRVAQATCTNRTYLSKYINTVYDCSFKSWITHLRIEEAKALMHDNPELSMSDIAKQTGFASVESFSHTFTRYEQLSPSKWRKKTEETDLEPTSIL